MEPTYGIVVPDAVARRNGVTWYPAGQCRPFPPHEAGRANGGRSPCPSPYTRQVIAEALRVYPPLYVLARWTEQPVDLDTVRLPTHAMVVVSPYTLHRRADYFPDPERFDPERFTPEAMAARPRYAYVPFGAGPRQCIGNHFAMMELQLILATLA